MTMQFKLFGSFAALMLVAGCGGSGDTSSESKSDDGATVAATDGWDATNACALLDKADVGAALKDEVTEATVGLVNKANGPNAATSECTYSLKSGGRATLMARNSPIADNTEEAIKTTRDATQASVSAFTDKKIEDVPGLGKAAFFVPGINQLNVFIDDKRFAILTIRSVANDSAKTVATELFAKIKT